MTEYFKLTDVISFLEKRDFSQFRFKEGCACICTKETFEIFIEAPDNGITEENAARIIDVLSNLDECIEKGHDWLRKLDIEEIEKYYHKLDQMFEVDGMYFGKLGLGHDPNPIIDGFSIDFYVHYDPCRYTVKYHYKGKRPFAVQEWVW